MSEKRKIIIVTDGDSAAQQAVKKAAENIGARCISASGGSPTPLEADEIIKMIHKAPHDPVVVMVDDRGHSGMGKGEQVLFQLANHPELEVLGVIAVASNTENVNGTRVDCSVTRSGSVVNGSVDKKGVKQNGMILYGDTVDILEKCNIPTIVGIGDIGKMGGKDRCTIGAPVITKAMKEILKRSGYKIEDGEK